MTGEIAIAGVFFQPLLVAACIALPLAEVATRLLSYAGFYRFVWHRGLFDVAMTITLWVAVAALVTGAPFNPLFP